MRVLRAYGMGLLLGALFGWSLTMTLITGDFFWLPWEDWEITAEQSRP